MSEIKLGVSLYSYTDDLNTVLTFDDALDQIADLGAEGLEILGEANIPNYPEPSADWIESFRENVERRGLTPTNYGSWVDTNLWRHRDLTVDEGVQMLSKDMWLASSLGFSSIRPKFGVVSMDLNPHPIWREVSLRCLDLAAELDLVICPEIHAPTPIKHPVVDEYINFIEATKSEHFRLLIDTGIFQRTITNTNVAGLSDEAQDEGWRKPLAVPMADLADVLPYTHFIQAKFFEIGEDLVDPQIPWLEIVGTLRDNNWSGYLSSEYEGDRSPYAAIEQVRRQHALLRGILESLTIPKQRS